MPNPISVVDLFAGPGGLAEGFASLENSVGPRFRIALSVENEASAFRTLRLRSFFRQFAGKAPKDYYDYVAGRIPLADLQRNHPRQWMSACEETQQLELGAAGTNAILDPLLDGVVQSANGLSVLVGGPPCQAYSLVGRARNRGVSGYVASEDQRHFLYREYIRILGRLKPAVFVMENVKGILSSSVDGNPIFDRVLTDLRAAGGRDDSYRLVQMAPGGSASGFVLKSEAYGIPQARHRVIILGVRSDIANRLSGIELGLEPLEETPTVASVLDDMPLLRSGLSRGGDSGERWALIASDAVSAAAEACRRMTGPAVELSKRLNAVAGEIRKHGAKRPRGSSAVTAPRDARLADWLSDPQLRALPNNETRGHMPADLARYAFVAAFAARWKRSPRASEFPPELAPAHGNWHSGKFVDRFRAQRWDAPSSTITSHISKDGHYFIHPDPVQCRSLTVREAARLQTFPDNYFFEGKRTAQFVQVGNAVPPLLARQIAGVVARIIDSAGAIAAVGETTDQQIRPDAREMVG
jgi:DNA (cytosine-5)-methyltransferase 1